MIIGGVSGAGKTSSLRTGFSEAFMPCLAFVTNNAVTEVINQTTKIPMKFVASVRIRNVADTAWIDLGTVTYFQILKNSDGGFYTANVTVAQAETWSAYKTGTVYPYLLSPSARACQIKAGLEINGTQYLKSIFYGQIENYSESQGANSSSINLLLSDIRTQLQKKTCLAIAYYQTKYRAALRELKNFITTGGVVSNALKMLLFVPDAGETDSDTKTGNSLDALESLIPGIQKTRMNGSGVSFWGLQDDKQYNYSFEYDDDNIFSLSLNADDKSTFNSVRIVYYDTTWKYTTIQDAADVALRGNVFYYRLVGGFNLAKSTELAQNLIAFSLYKNIRIEIAFNPYIEPGQIIKISSTKYGIPASYATVNKVIHQYSVGRALTYLNDLKLVTI